MGEHARGYVRPKILPTARLYTQATILINKPTAVLITHNRGFGSAQPEFVFQ